MRDESEKQNKFFFVIRLNEDTVAYRRPAKGCRKMLYAFIELQTRRSENIPENHKAWREIRRMRIASAKKLFHFVPVWCRARIAFQAIR